MDITKLDQMVDLVKSKPRKRLVAANANDEHTIQAVNAAVDLGVIDATLVGDTAAIEQVCKTLNIDINKFKIIHETVDTKAAAMSCDLINNGEGDILMKGLLPTDKYMRAILNKERGLCPPNATLSHVAVIENPVYHKLLIVGDVAIIPLPDLKQKQVILRNLVNTAKAIGIAKPKVALICATEQMLAGMQACVDAALIAKMAERGQIGGAYVDGPLSLDIAIDKETAEIKKLKSDVAGDADCLLFPNIESGNVFYKCCTKFNHAEIGAILMGAKVPCVLSSRGDSAKTKLYSISLAALLAK
ncbi:MAG: phosphate butyryltransferase [Bacteroidales bacterium]|nr:phosphate butyryltransferase [Bacteroidales bacterium]